jgi:hypothetical protein
MNRLLAAFMSALLTASFPSFSSAETAQPLLEEGTAIRLKLVEPVSSKTSSVGQKIQLSVAEDVTAKDGKTVVIKEFAPATAFLTNVDEKDGGKGGKLSVEVTTVKAVDGTKVTVRGIQTKSGQGGAGVASYVVGGVLLGVVGLGLVALAGGRGKNAQIPAGTIFTAYVNRDTTITIAPLVEPQAEKNIAVESDIHAKSEQEQIIAPSKTEVRSEEAVKQ